MTSVRIEQLSKNFGTTVAVRDVSLSIPGGELFFLLGPSGCGKSTLLRLIAGLHEPDAGRIFFDDRDVTSLGTEKRNAVMCFQSYALWPHMSVRDNVAFGLDVRHFTKAQRQSRVDEMLHLVQMSELADRKPNQLSGGQQQRVALARALAVQPACLLLDEPLSNLDAKLRGEMRSEIRRISKSAGVTTIYVTHDQKEALSTADRIAVMKDGAIAQIGSPSDLYHRPDSTFVAQFIGDANLLRGKVISIDSDAAVIETRAGKITADSAKPLAVSQSVALAIRPEQLSIDSDSTMQNRLPARIIESTFMGDSTELLLDVNGERVTSLTTAPIRDHSKNVTVSFDPNDAIVLPE